MPKLPAFQFYPGDWLKDPALSKCEPATRGIWIDAIAAMHENCRSGALVGTPGQLSRVLRCSEAAFMAAVDDLHATNTADVTVCRGIVTLVNRRMAEEAKLRENNRLRQTKHRRGGNVTKKSRLYSSSSSSSSTSNHSPPLPPEGKNRQRKRPNPKRSLPEDFLVTDGMKSWAAISAPAVDLERETGKFMDYHKSRGNVMRDWEAAWRTWIGNARDWSRSKPALANDNVDTSEFFDTGRTHGKPVR